MIASIMQCKMNHESPTLARLITHSAQHPLWQFKPHPEHVSVSLVHMSMWLFHFPCVPFLWTCMSLAFLQTKLVLVKAMRALSGQQVHEWVAVLNESWFSFNGVQQFACACNEFSFGVCTISHACCYSPQNVILLLGRDWSQAKHLVCSIYRRL